MILEEIFTTAGIDGQCSAHTRASGVRCEREADGRIPEVEWLQYRYHSEYPKPSGDIVPNVRVCQSHADEVETLLRAKGVGLPMPTGRNATDVQ